MKEFSVETLALLPSSVSMCTSAFSFLIYKAVKPTSPLLSKELRSNPAEATEPANAAAPPMLVNPTSTPTAKPIAKLLRHQFHAGTFQNICKQASITADGTAQLPVSQELCGSKVLVHLRKSKNFSSIPKKLEVRAALEGVSPRFASSSKTAGDTARGWNSGI